MDFLREYIQQIPEGWQKVFLQWGGGFLRLILIILLAKLALNFAYKLIDSIFMQRERGLSLGEKAQMFSGFLKSFLRYLVIFIAIMMILRELKVDLTPILAGAGIAGLAIGFGAQSLVKDIITGFFIIIEDHYSVGDYVTVESLSGIVEQVGLRTTRIRDFGGQLHIIPNSRIEVVTNFSRGPQRSMVDISVSYQENIDYVLDVLKDLCEKFASENPDIIEGPTVLGVVDMGESNVIVRITARTQPMQQWHIERELRREIKKSFDQKGIEIPYPRRVLFLQQDMEKDEKKAE